MNSAPALQAMACPLPTLVAGPSRPTRPVISEEKIHSRSGVAMQTTEALALKT